MGAQGGKAQPALPPMTEAIAGRSPNALEALLRDLGGQLRPGGAPAELPGLLATGLPTADRLLGGGLPRGRLCELVGRPSSGRTGLLLTLLARTTRTGELTACVDAADAFDPASAEAAGVVLPRVLWVRAPSLRPALRSTERLLEARGFGLIVLDAAAHVLPPAACLRLGRRAAASGTALVLLSSQRRAGPFAEAVLATRQVGCRFQGVRGVSEWLEGLDARLELVRHRALHAGTSAELELRSRV